MPGGYVGGRPKDESKLSRDPAQVRNRLRRAMKNNPARDARISRDIEILYRKPVTEWDLEELARGRPRNATNDFRGRTPGWITPTLQKEAKRRLVTETTALMSQHVDLAVRAIVGLINSTEVDEKGKPIVDARTRFAAAAFIIEHVVGKPKAIIEIDAMDETKTAIAAAIVLDDGLPQDPIHKTIEGQFTEDDEMEEIDDDDA